jgi:hypothetical protein
LLGVEDGARFGFCVVLSVLPDPAEPLEPLLPVAEEPLLVPPAPALLLFRSQPARVAASARAKARVRARFMQTSFEKPRPMQFLCDS